MQRELGSAEQIKSADDLKREKIQAQMSNIRNGNIDTLIKEPSMTRKQKGKKTCCRV